jgi:arylsulfatase A-like enzyme
VKTLRQALVAGLVLGSAWGALEALILLVGPWASLSVAMGAPQPVAPLPVAAIMVMAALRYALPTMLLTVLAIPLGRLLWGRGDNAELAAARTALALLLFVNIFWWTKPMFAFSWGFAWHHPQRLLLSAGWAVLAALLATLIVHPRGARGIGLGAPGPRLTWATVLLLVVGGAAAHLREDRVKAQDATFDGPRPPNVLLVVVDALRADRLGCYGYDVRQPSISPNVDALASQGVTFERTVVQAPFTWTSFGSMLTGKYPRQHGLIRMSPFQVLDTARNRTLAQALNDVGYSTGAFLTGTLSNNTGLLRGFDTYCETIVGHEPVNRHSKWSMVRSELLLSVLHNKVRQALDSRLVNTEAMAWIKDHADVPFFAMVHYYSTHTPYDPPEPFKSMYDPEYPGSFHPFFQSHGIWIIKQQQEGTCEHDGNPTWECEHFDPVRDGEHIGALYDGGVAFADDMLGDLLQLLDDEGIADDTLVIFTSDHGEELYDHGVFDHDWMFNTNLYVPFVWRMPGRLPAGARVPWPVEMLDLPATVLALTGVGSMQAGHEASELPSRSLVPDAQGIDPGANEHDAFAENVRYLSMISDNWKLTQNRFSRGSLRIFDLVEDPAELYPLTTDDPRFAAAFADLLPRLNSYDLAQPEAAAFALAGDKQAAMERLKTLMMLGYIEASPEVLEAIDEGNERALELIGDTELVGSNHVIEESLYTWPHAWPPKLGAARPAGDSDEDG